MRRKGCCLVGFTTDVYHGKRVSVCNFVRLFRSSVSICLLYRVLVSVIFRVSCSGGLLFSKGFPRSPLTLCNLRQYKCLSYQGFSSGDGLLFSQGFAMIILCSHFYTRLSFALSRQGFCSV